MHVVEIEMAELSDQDRILIKEHCGVISSSLLRATTENLIKLKYVTDTKDVDHYVTACTVRIEGGGGWDVGRGRRGD